MLVANGEGLRLNDLQPEFEILGFADAEMAPIEFNKTPTLAINKALANLNLSVNDVDYFEINEVKS